MFLLYVCDVVYVNVILKGCGRFIF